MLKYLFLIVALCLPINAYAAGEYVQVTVHKNKTLSFMQAYELMGQIDNAPLDRVESKWTADGKMVYTLVDYNPAEHVAWIKYTIVCDNKDEVLVDITATAITDRKFLLRKVRSKVRCLIYTNMNRALDDAWDKFLEKGKLFDD